MISLSDFSGFNAEQVQKDNIGGVVSVGLVHDKRFTRIWPTPADVTDGEITVAPPLLAGVKIARWDVPQNSVRFKDGMIGTHGGQNFKQNVELAVAGMDKIVIKETRKLINSGVVFFFQDPTGQWFVAGQGLKGIVLTSEGDTGQTGTDRKGSVFTGENNGYPYGLLPLADTLVADLDFDTVDYSEPVVTP